MLIVFISSRGVVREARVVKTTEKGWRVEAPSDFHDRPMGFMVFARCPHNNHRTYEDREAAESDALRFIVDQETAARGVLKRMSEKRASLSDTLRPREVLTPIGRLSGLNHIQAGLDQGFSYAEMRELGYISVPPEAGL